MTTGETTEKPSFGERFLRARGVSRSQSPDHPSAWLLSQDCRWRCPARRCLLWMKDVGVDIKTIGLFALVGVPYTIKFLWAPIVDAFKVPFLSRALGHRRGWLVFSQLLLIVAILLLGVQDPVSAPLMVALAAVIVATASATPRHRHRCVPTEYLPTDAQAAGMAISSPPIASHAGLNRVRWPCPIRTYQSIARWSGPMATPPCLLSWSAWWRALAHQRKERLERGDLRHPLAFLSRGHRCLRRFSQPDGACG